MAIMTATIAIAAIIPNALTGALKPDTARRSDGIVPKYTGTDSSREDEWNDSASMKRASTTGPSADTIVPMRIGTGMPAPGASMISGDIGKQRICQGRCLLW